MSKNSDGTTTLEDSYRGNLTRGGFRLFWRSLDKKASGFKRRILRGRARKGARGTPLAAIPADRRLKA